MMTKMRQNEETLRWVRRYVAPVLVGWMLAAASLSAQVYPTPTEAKKVPLPTSVCAPCIEAHMEFLASDALRGRGSGTADELVAATYIAAQLHAYGLTPAGDKGTYIQKVTIVKRGFSAPPELRVGDGNKASVWLHGKDMQVRMLSDAAFAGPLQKLDAAAEPALVHPGAVVFVTGDNTKVRHARFGFVAKGAFAVLYEGMDDKVEGLPQVMPRPEGTVLEKGHFNLIRLGAATATALQALPDGTLLTFGGTLKPEEHSSTWNAVGMIPGGDPALNLDAILLSAHLDHLGVGEPVKGDAIYNGADDDASGTTAVLELARVLGAGPRPKRTIIFALFGSEESGGLGSDYFASHPPLPLQNIAMNLNFEMIGRPDPKYKPDELWLTGWERSNLGPTLAVHGAKLVADARPEQEFFARSDNYGLAKKGIVAHTVSSFGLHADYHQPSDDLAKIDFDHMTRAIASMVEPLQWLANADFAPAWNPGGKP